ncbi:hypothetical protein DWV06_17760 [Anaerosacchariphilus polymeriproducens]|uniref:Uncharacterized protein n=1 Tax=Anaerosacchariphilus polymeriproducens TaxID=1812858 RepID=A0A371AQW4_9FIRM|nr:hypothetical protein DWV06_17760 [Anaerosacchariphilus polymeriproducens]
MLKLILNKIDLLDPRFKNGDFSILKVSCQKCLFFKAVKKIKKILTYKNQCANMEDALLWSSMPKTAFNI